MRKGPRKPPPPLDAQMLEAIAVRYVERFQTSRARLLRLLNQKIRQRGWAEGEAPPDPAATAARMVALGYVDDAAFADARARGLALRGMGATRVRATLSGSGIDQEVAAEALATHDPVDAAIRFARRKRLGPFGAPVSDPRLRQRALAAFARAGHGPRLARAILDAATEEELEGLSEG